VSGAERAFASRQALCLLLPQTQQLLQYGFADGTVRSFAPRKSSTGGGAACCFHALHFGEPVTAACTSSDGDTLVTADALGGLAVWRLVHPHSGSFRLEPRGRLASHATAVCSVACDASQQVLASAGNDGAVHLWDLRRLRLLHVLQVHAPTMAPGGDVVAMQIKEETGDLALATHDQLQLWSINAALLAVSHVRVPAIRCMALTPTPEWMVESLPVLASGHEDGTVRWWVVREPTSCTPRPGSAVPHARSSVPVGGALQPAWELTERSELRLRAAERVPITSLCMGEGSTRLLWTGDARGEVRSWSVAAEGGADYFAPLAERF